MKNILVLTTVYPAPDIPKTDTPVVHYFVREWVKMGYNVRVVHNVANFPRILYLLAKPFKDVIGAKAGFGIRTVPYKDCEYVIDGVPVKRIGIFKLCPHVLHPRRSVERAINKTIQYCESSEFYPDVVIGHWPNPQLEMMKALKSYFNCKSCYVSHGDSVVKLYKERSLGLINDIDIIGFRGEQVKKDFFNEIKINKPYFFCYSGVPESYIIKDAHKDLSNIHDFIYVGTLIKRKYPAQIVAGLAKAFGKEDFLMRYVGSGAEQNNIESSIVENHVEGNVELLGRLERSDVKKLIEGSQVFIMISKGEAFGLVYLEAMATGCITIASRNEGFDGIIKDGENGFLCEAGNAEELASIIRKIRSMSEEELQQISRNAIATAESLTDFKAAKIYIDSVENAIKD